jgi:hypothetical protein
VKIRAAASIVLTAGLLLGVSGCEFIAPQQTERSYQPSDGINASTGGVDIRNAFVVTTDGTSGSLIVTLVSSNDAATTVTLQYTADSGTMTKSVKVPGDGALNIRPGGDVAVTMFHVDAKAGALLPIDVQANGSNVQLQVPILDNTLPGYATLTPSPSPTPTPTATPTDEATPTDSASPSS